MMNGSAVFFSHGFLYEEYDNPLFYSKETLVSRSLSGSYSLKEGDPGYQTYLQKIHAVFRKYERDGKVEMPNKTVVYFGCI